MGRIGCAREGMTQRAKPTDPFLRSLRSFAAILVLPLFP
jgi:hypothetical protein